MTRTRKVRFLGASLAATLIAAVVGIGLVTLPKPQPAAAAPTAPSFTADSPPNGTAGTAYTYTFVASGDTPITFTPSGTLPPGLTFNSATPTTVTLSGNPNTPGSYNFAVTASNGVLPDAPSGPLTVVIAGVKPTFTAGTPPNGTAGTPYTYTFVATGNPTPTLSETGPLPPGLIFTPATGVLAGTPNTPGTYPFTVTATNSAGATPANASVTISGVGPALPEPGQCGRSTRVAPPRPWRDPCSQKQVKSLKIKAFCEKWKIVEFSLFGRILILPSR